MSNSQTLSTERGPAAALDRLLYEQSPQAWALHDVLRRAFTGTAVNSRPFPTDPLSVIEGMKEAMPGAKRATLDVQRATGRWTEALHTPDLSGLSSETKIIDC